MAPPRRIRLSPLGFVLDGALLASVAYLCLPGLRRLASAASGSSPLPPLSSLPTPLGVNATGLLLPARGSSVPASAAALSAQAWFNYALGSDCGADAAARPEAAYFLAANEWKNSLVLPRWLRTALPHVLATWLRNMIAGWALYFGVGGAWAAVIYGLCGARFFPRGAASMPSWTAMRAQIAVSAEAMVLYTLAPTAGEWAIERGWTLAYHDPARAAAWLGLPPLGAGAVSLTMRYSCIGCAASSRNHSS